MTDPQWKNDQGFKDWAAFMQKYHPTGSLQDEFNAYGYSVAQTRARAQAVWQLTFLAPTS